jgi:hypothetical protein
MDGSSVPHSTTRTKLKEQLDRPSKATSRESVALNNWQIEETKISLIEAGNGDFACDKEVQRTSKKWTRRAR